MSCRSVPHTVLTTVEYWASRFRARLPPSGRPHGASLAFGAAVRLRLLPHAPLRCHAVAFDSQLPPTGPVGDLHPQSIIHVQHTRRSFARPHSAPCPAKPKRGEVVQYRLTSSSWVFPSPPPTLNAGREGVSLILAQRG